mmetsp:Transcript_12269/g.14814  ORF Transcript_12269/g.14814 Transcript_12269/m.14814 type:complete len:147 (-) Transcript_12269:143-583(-)|eukprot:CAMPEP_0114347242 /NCGR_PEP_ID=MMETSP0101-20121206/13747_1 /TAXON_ID=38822 ORGANISM="Pteridomonas danica, Strain PT" /NCGR_SAMPLE_ID=MMETSP0101 /ASSEMBLY_ACC=CAM_ASM_000211 /LENGTH=146 /DNA_ID=CAMNT_0001484441 /DNA_START=69 /DNA_END=509 /DNA_ORIENTATION=-
MFSAIKKSWANGNALMVTGGICTAASGFILWRMDAEETVTKAEVNNLPFPSNNEISGNPVLYRARVIRALSASFDGPIALKNLSENESVGIIRENIGPNKDYHLARSFKSDGDALSEGWYPKRFLQVEIQTPSEVKSPVTQSIKNI